MADVTGWNRNGGIFWIRDTSDEDQPMVFVPGVSREKIMGMKEGSRCGLDREGKMKPNKVDRNAVAGSSAKRKLCVAPEHKAKGSPVYATPSAMSAVRSRADSRFLPPAVPSTELAEADQAKSRACLKDLCPEDKRRIANLIQELARVTEEKDETMQRLHDEQESFERKIQQLEEQNQLIVQERQSLQQQYRECQELLSLYQQYLSQQHEKLSQSCSQREQVSTDEFVPAGPRRLGGHECSYLGLSNHEAVKGDGQRSSRTDAPTQHPSSSYQPSDPAERASQVTGPQGVRQGPQHPGTFKCAGSVTADSACRSTKEMCGSFCSPCEMRIEDGGPSSSEVVATAPPAGQEDWKERRNRLLLQKMELEVERERLQACLAQQEERLLQQRQRLRQSRLEHSRLPDVPVGGSDSVSNGLELQKQNTPRGDLSCQMDVRVLPVGTAGQPATDKGTMSHPVDQSLHSGGAVTLPTKHAAPSTVESGVQLQSVPSAVDKTPRSRSLRITQPCSLDSTLIELLEVISPISGRDYTGFLTQQRLKPPFIASGVRGVSASASFAPPPPPQHSMQEDPAESQLLEEIFFIC